MIAKKRRGRPSRTRPKPLGDDELPPLPELRKPRIRYVKEYSAGPVAPLQLSQEINHELGTNAESAPSVVAVHAVPHVDGKDSVLVVFERDDRRANVVPFEGREKRRAGKKEE